MYTYVWIDSHIAEGSDRPFVRGALDRCASTTAATFSYGDTTVQQGSYGLSFLYRERLLALPTELEDEQITRVSMEVPYWGPKLRTGVYRRRHATAIVTRDTYADHRPDSWRFTVHGDSLAAVNRLFDDLVTGKAVPRVSYEK